MAGGAPGRRPHDSHDTRTRLSARVCTLPILYILFLFFPYHVSEMQIKMRGERQDWDKKSLPAAAARGRAKGAVKEKVLTYSYAYRDTGMRARLYGNPSFHAIMASLWNVDPTVSPAPRYPWRRSSYTNLAASRPSSLLSYCYPALVKRSPNSHRRKGVEPVLFCLVRVVAANAFLHKYHPPARSLLFCLLARKVWITSHTGLDN
jgi:hypothetical protein